MNGTDSFSPEYDDAQRGQLGGNPWKDNRGYRLSSYARCDPMIRDIICVSC